MDSTFTGRVTLYSSMDKFKGPEPVDGVSFVARFSDDGKAVTITAFTPVVIPDIDTEMGKMVLTATLPKDGAGTLDRTNGSMAVQAKFRFKLDKLPGHSSLNLALSTATAALPDGRSVQGAPLASGSGAFKLVAAGSFEGGALDNKRCSVIVEGVLTPSPL
jgi:hypothetical protein